MLARPRQFSKTALLLLKRSVVLSFSIIVVALFSFLALLRFGALTPLVNFALAHALAPLTPVQVRLGTIRSDAFNYLEADDVVVLAPLKGIKVPLMTIESLRLEFDTYGAWRGRVPRDETLKLARIRGLNLFVLRDVEGHWNTSVLTEGHVKSPQNKSKPMALPLLPAGRVELENSKVVFNDESKGFHSTIERLQGSLDTRALPFVAVSLVGRTEGVARDNLSLAGEVNLREKSLDGRLDLADVELKEYLNYFLPGKGLRFTAGRASLSVRLQSKAGQELLAEGRADLEGGQMTIPGIADPLSAMNGRVSFDPNALHFKALSARFLGSQWSAEGGLNDLRHPQFDVRLTNNAFGLEALSSQIKGLEPLALSGSAAVDVTLSGPANKPFVKGTINAPWLRVAGVDLQQARSSVVLYGPLLRVDSLKAVVWDGSIDASMSLGLGKNGHLRADMVLDGSRLELAQIQGQRPLPLSGTAFVELKMHGPIKNLEVDGHLELHKGYLGVLALGKVTADVHWAPADWETKFDVLDGRIHGVVGVEGKPAIFKKSLIQFQGIDLGALARGVATAPESKLLSSAASKFAAMLESHFQGQTDANLSIEGPMKEALVWIELKRLKGQLVFNDGPLQLANSKLPLELDGEGSLGFGAGDVYFGRNHQPLQLKLSQKGKTWEAQALGRYPLKNTGISGALEFSLDGDLRLLDVFPFFSRSTGRLTFDGRLGGTFDAPQALGDLKIDGFATEPLAYLAPIKNGSLRAQLREQVIELSQLKFQAGGLVDATGRLDLSAGIADLTGELTVKTDAEGLRLQNWDSMGAANVILQPLSIALLGENQPMALSGRIELSNAVIVYGGQKKTDEDAPVPAKGNLGLNLDLRVGLGKNVWYEKQHDKKIDLFDPLRSALDSAVETLERPDMYFRLKPTEQDFVVQGTTPDVQLRGELTIDRGRMILMENEFEIKPERKAARIRFAGKRAEVWAAAVARLRYMREDPLTKRPFQRAVNVVVDISPLPEEELEKSGLANSFLNYRLDFSSEPEIVQGNAALQRSAILNLVVLGDPVVDEEANAGGGAADSTDSNQRSGRLIDTQLTRLVSGEFRKWVASWSKTGFKFLGKGFIDVFRVVPRLKYQAASSSSAKTSGTITAAEASNQARDSQLTVSDITLEAGKSIGEKLYASLQVISFGESTIASQAQAEGTTNRIIRNKGIRAGLELQLSPNRTLESFYNYSVDDNLEPVAFEPDKLEQARSASVRLRNTLPTGTYTDAVSRNRRWQENTRP